VGVARYAAACRRDVSEPHGRRACPLLTKAGGIRTGSGLFDQLSPLANCFWFHALVTHNLFMASIALHWCDRLS
jgi:hypothetical protein